MVLISLLELSERLILGRRCRCTSIGYNAHHPAVVLCTGVSQLGNLRIKL